MTVNTAAVASRAGLKVILTTENGTCPVNSEQPDEHHIHPGRVPELGRCYHQNATYIFNNKDQLAQLPVASDREHSWRLDCRSAANCFVSGGPVTSTGGNTADNAGSLTELGAADAANRPSGPVTAVLCSPAALLLSAQQADYSRNTGVTTDPAIASGDGVTVALRSQP